jgi:hypothetical protein
VCLGTVISISPARMTEDITVIQITEGSDIGGVYHTGLTGEQRA